MSCNVGIPTYIRVNPGVAPGRGRKKKLRPFFDDAARKEKTIFFPTEKKRFFCENSRRQTALRRGDCLLSPKSDTHAKCDMDSCRTSHRTMPKCDMDSCPTSHRTMQYTILRVLYSNTAVVVVSYTHASIADCYHHGKNSGAC